MAKWQNDSMLDAALDYLASTVTRACICSAQPTTYTEATATFMLANVTMDSGDFTKLDGDTSGRKLVIGEQKNIIIDNDGVANHIALVSVADTTLRYVTTCLDATLVATASVDIPTWEIEIADAS